MSLKLSEKDQSFLSGNHGRAAQRAMRIIVRLAELMGVDELIDVSQVHIDACGMLTMSGLQFVEMLAEEGGKVVVPTTLNIIPLDMKNWQRQGVPEEYAHIVHRIVNAYLKMDCIPTLTCAPYQGYLAPRFNQQVAWGESNAIVYANSVLGAKTERYADYFDVCVSLTGRTPKFGLHTTEGRRGQFLLRLIGFSKDDFQDSSLYPALGHLVGKISGDYIPVIDGVNGLPTSDMLKALGAASASSGSVGLFHMVGVTPEASTIEEAFQGALPLKTVDIHPVDLEKAKMELSTIQGNGAHVDVVHFGCPHFSFDEIRQLATKILACGKKLHPGTRMVITTNRAALALLEGSQYTGVVEEFGGEFILDSCIFHTPVLSPNIKTIMTNSGKCAYYSPGELDVDAAFGSMDECLESAIRGTIYRGA